MYAGLKTWKDLAWYRCLFAVTLMASAGAAMAQPALNVEDISQFTLVSQNDLVHFGNVVQGDRFSKQFVLFNPGDENLTIQQINVFGQNSLDWDAFLTGGASLPRTVPPGDTVNMVVEFAPPAFHNPPGSSAIISISTNAPTATFQFNVAGTVLDQAPTSALIVEIGGFVATHNGTVNLGDLILGETYEIEMIARSTGQLDLSLTGMAVDGASAADFTILDAGNTQVAPGGTEDLLLALTPSSLGSMTATAKIFNNSPTSPYTINFIAKVYDDCNGNDVADVEDIAAGSSLDCDETGVPDECETDSDGDGAIDGCDVCPGEDDFLDTDNDGTPDCREGNGGGNPAPLPGVGPCGVGAEMSASASLMGLMGFGIRRRRMRVGRRMGASICPGY